MDSIAELALNSSISAFLSAVAAIFSSLAAFLAIRQTVKQRETTYRPDIMAKRNRLELTSNIDDYTYFCKNGNANSKLIRKAPFIELINIGFGAAKSIDYEWQFDQSILLDCARKRADLSIDVRPMFWQIDFRDQKIMINAASDRTGRIDYIFPVSQKGSSTLIALPHIYIFLIRHAFYHWMQIDEKRKFEKIPSIYLKCEYSDIADQRHTLVFKFNMVMNRIKGHDAEEVLVGLNGTRTMSFKI